MVDKMIVMVDGKYYMNYHVADGRCCPNCSFREGDTCRDSLRKSRMCHNITDNFSRAFKEVKI